MPAQTQHAFSFQISSLRNMPGHLCITIHFLAYITIDPFQLSLFAGVLGFFFGLVFFTSSSRLQSSHLSKGIYTHVGYIH